MSTRLHFDITSQISFRNQIKAGAEFVHTNLDLKHGEINNFINTENLTIRQDKPIRLAAYVQDRYETRGLSFTLGLVYAGCLKLMWGNGTYLYMNRGNAEDVEGVERILRIRTTQKGQPYYGRQ